MFRDGEFKVISALRGKFHYICKSHPLPTTTIPTNQRNPMTCSIECPTCKKYQAFIQAMVAEFEKYRENKTAQYYKGQCEKVLEQNKGDQDE